MIIILYVLYAIIIIALISFIIIVLGMIPLLAVGDPQPKHWFVYFFIGQGERLQRLGLRLIKAGKGLCKWAEEFIGG